MLSSDGMRIHAGRGAHAQLQHRTLLMDLFRGDTHLHAEKLADLARQQGVVHTHGTCLRAATTKRAAIRRFQQSDQCRDIQFDIFALQPCQHFAAGFGVLLHEPAEDFASKCRAIHFISAASHVDQGKIPHSSDILRSGPATRKLLEKWPVVSSASSYRSSPAIKRSTTVVLAFGGLPAAKPSGENPSSDMSQLARICSLRRLRGGNPAGESYGGGSGQSSRLRGDNGEADARSRPISDLNHGRFSMLSAGSSTISVHVRLRLRGCAAPPRSLVAANFQRSPSFTSSHRARW